MDPPFVIVMQCGIILSGMVLVARRFAIPMLVRHPLEDVLCLLCLIHTFRYAAFGAFALGISAPVSSDALSLTGDLVSPALAVIAAAMLHARMPGAIQVAWVFNLVGLADLLVVFPGAVNARVEGEALGLAWQILIFYTPALLVTHVMMLRWLYKHAASRSRHSAFA